MKNSFLIGLCLLCLYVQKSYAQQDDDFDDYFRQRVNQFDAYVRETQSDFEKHRARLNAQFADYLKQRWEEFEVLSGEKPPVLPEPDKPVVHDDKRQTPPERLPISTIPPVPVPRKPVPQEVPKREPSSSANYDFSFYNTPCRVTLDESHRFRLSASTEEAVSKTWNLLTKKDYETTLADCLRLRREFGLCDWPYAQMLGCLARSFLGETNEATVLQAYLLVQSGYDVRIVRRGTSLLLALTTDRDVYACTYLNIDGKKYYLLDAPAGNGGYYTFRNSFSAYNQPCSLKLDRLPRLSYAAAKEITVTSRRYPELSVKVTGNGNLMDFFTHYPVCRWDVYASTPLSPELAETLLPALKKQLAGKTVPEAANMLLNFVQTGFAYQTDQQQFGYERPFFPDELFLYPYSDCEDRSALFACLVRSLLKLDVVLLHYPDHLATALHFPDDVSGDYILVSGKKYIVCDPTFIGANIGQTMPAYKKVGAEVIFL